MPLYKCGSCQKGEIYLPGRVTVIECNRCLQPIVGSTPISQLLRRRLSSTEWIRADGDVLVDFIMGSTCVQAEVIDSASVLGQAFAACLESRRLFNATHRNVGHLSGRPGFASSDFKKRGALRRACLRVLGSSERAVQYNPNEEDPSVLGKLVEAEIGHRASKRISDDIISTAKVLRRVNHPLLGVEIHVLADGDVQQTMPLEIKTQAGMPEDERSLARIFPTLHQLALQAFSQGVDEAVLLLVDRRFDGAGEYLAIRVRNLLEYHLDLVQNWLQQGEDLASLVQELSIGGASLD